MHTEDIARMTETDRAEFIRALGYSFDHFGFTSRIHIELEYNQRKAFFLVCAVEDGDIPISAISDQAWNSIGALNETILEWMRKR